MVSKHTSKGSVLFISFNKFDIWIDELEEQLKSTWKMKSDFAFWVI